MSISLETDIRNTNSEEKLELPLRKINLPKETQLRSKDSIIIFDENFLNHILGYLFKSNTYYSFRKQTSIDELFDSPPFNNMGSGVFEGIITKKAISALPDFKGKDSPHRMLDLRCSFGEESLKEFLKEVRPSQV